MLFGRHTGGLKDEYIPFLQKMNNPMSLQGGRGKWSLQGSGSALPGHHGQQGTGLPQGRGSSRSFQKKVVSELAFKDILEISRWTKK